MGPSLPPSSSPAWSFQLFPYPETNARTEAWRRFARVCRVGGAAAGAPSRAQEAGGGGGSGAEACVQGPGTPAPGRAVGSGLHVSCLRPDRPLSGGKQRSACPQGRGEVGRRNGRGCPAHSQGPQHPLGQMEPVHIPLSVSQLCLRPGRGSQSGSCPDVDKVTPTPRTGERTKVSSHALGAQSQRSHAPLPPGLTTTGRH